MSTLLAEILSQPEAVTRLLDREAVPMRRLASSLPPFSYALIAARGSSDHAAIYARYLWGHLAAIPVAFAAPSLHTIYKTPPRFEGALIVGISQSGQSPDVVAVLEEGRRQKRPTLAITNDPASPIAKTADHVILLGVTETSIAATLTYTCSLAAVAMMGALWGGRSNLIEELRAVPHAMEDTLKMSAEPCARAAAELRDEKTMLPIARGLNLVTAHEMALKLRELVLLSTHAFSAADFRHGSNALLAEGQGLPCTLVMPAGPARADMEALAAALEAGGARLTVISDDPSAATGTRLSLPMAPGTPEWLTPLTAILPGQRLAFESALARGLDPDHPRGLSEKVVRTT